jgi:hypothetical protein
LYGISRKRHLYRMQKSYCLFAFLLITMQSTAQKKPAAPKNDQSENIIICHVEKEAYFPDERTTWTRYLERNNRFDSIYQLLTENTRSWTVYVQFVVNREGAVEVTGIKGDSLLHTLFKAEIIRLFQQSPKWEAAEQNGRKIKSFRNQKLGFVVPADEKEEPAKKPARVPETSIPQKTLSDGSNASQFFI